MADTQEQASYCSNCKKVLVCKYTNDLIKKLDLTIKKFNDDYKNYPIRITVTSINYNCNHKDKI